MTTKNYLIYELRCKDPAVKDIYIGSTTNLKQRLNCHKTNANNPNSIQHNYKVYKVIRENGGWDNWEAKEVEKLTNVSKVEARIREQEISGMLGATLNMWKAHRYLEQAKAYYGKDSEWYVANHERSKNRYKNMCKKMADLQKENTEMKAKLDAINEILK